jgi:hydrogenase-4 component E
MTYAVDLVLVFVILSNMALLGSSRLAQCIRIAAVQAMVLSALPLLATRHGLGPELLRAVLLGVVIFVLKGLVFPRMLQNALRTANVRHEVEPFLGFAASLLLGIIILVLSFWISTRLELPHPSISPLMLPLALSTILIGLALIVTRRTALMQVVGYLVLENGSYIFGIALAEDQPLLVEMGILLDIFVAVFAMGITIFHISREFDHIDVDQLTQLKD